MSACLGRDVDPSPASSAGGSQKGAGGGEEGSPFPGGKGSLRGWGVPDRERELGGQASRGEPTLGRKQHQRGNCEPAWALATFKHLGALTLTTIGLGVGVVLQAQAWERGWPGPRQFIGHKPKASQGPLWRQRPSGWRQRQSGAGPTSHTPSYHIWQKLVFKVQRLDQRENRGGGPWEMVAQACQHSQPWNCGCLAGTWLQRWPLGAQDWCPS